MEEYSQAEAAHDRISGEPKARPKPCRIGCRPHRRMKRIGRPKYQNREAFAASALLEVWWEQIRARQAQSPEKMVAAIHDCMGAAEYEPIRLSVDTWVFKGIRYTSGGPYTMSSSAS